MTQKAINSAFSIRRPIPYDEWLQMRNERNALAVQVDRQTARIRELQVIIKDQRAQLLSAGASMSNEAQIRAEISLMTGEEAPHE
jgi:hypothetical protein